MAKNSFLYIAECSNCGKKVEVRQRNRLKNKHIFCGKECFIIFKRKERYKTPGYLNCKCPICGTVFHLKPYNINKYKNNYCSKECKEKAQMEYMKGEGNHQYGLKGQLNKSWKSDKKINSYGYIKIRCLDHPFKDYDGFVFEHRLIAEKYLLTEENSIEINGKRYLKLEYSVHHKDRNKQNNDVSNLEVLTKKEHLSLHAKERAIKKPVYKLDLEENIIEGYDSIKQAALDNNINSQNITHVCKNKKGTAGGFKWRYKNDI